VRSSRVCDCFGSCRLDGDNAIRKRHPVRATHIRPPAVTRLNAPTKLVSRL